MTAIFVYENPNVALAARTLLLAGYAIENSRRQPTHIEILCHKTSALSLLAHCDHDDRACDAPRSRRPESQRTEGPDLLAARTTSQQRRDRKSTRLNSSHSSISYAVLCLKKKKS